MRSSRIRNGLGKAEESEMGKIGLGLAAMAAIALAAPANAGTPEEPFVGVPNAKGDLGTFAGNGGFTSGFGDRRFDRRRGSNSSGGGIWVNGGEWANYNNRSFSPDSYNDWWHDSPNHSQPAWVRNNQNCDRQWFAADTLRC
jgi:hypothetical protein